MEYKELIKGDPCEICQMENSVCDIQNECVRFRLACLEKKIINKELIENPYVFRTERYEISENKKPVLIEEWAGIKVFERENGAKEVIAAHFPTKKEVVEALGDVYE